MLCTAARGAAFARPHYAPRITKVHIAAARTQSPSTAFIGYDSTTLFHHVVYAASYTVVQLRCRQRRTLHPGAVSTRQGIDMLDGGFPRAGKEIQE